MLLSLSSFSHAALMTLAAGLGVAALASVLGVVFAVHVRTLPAFVKLVPYFAWTSIFGYVYVAPVCRARNVQVLLAQLASF